MNLLDFANEEYINLITYKKDSSAVATPVWLSSVNDYLVVTTSVNAGKVKRVKANGKATIYKTNQNGSEKLSEEIEVKASIIEDESEKLKGIKSIKKKYFPVSKMFIRGSNENRVIIKLEEKEE